jgi:hypothetical protein
MTPDRLKERLSEIPAPRAVQARERAVAEARAEVAARADESEGSPGGAPAIFRERPRLAALAAAALLALVVLLTPPGRAASAWVGDLVGIGDVGGPPTRDKPAGWVKPSTAVVIDNGVAPDGTRYEWVAYQCKMDLEREGIGPSFEGIGLSLDWPGVKDHEDGGFCEELEGRPARRTFSGFGVQVLPSQFKGVAEPDLVISGTTGPRVHRVSVIYTDGEGNERELPVDFARVEGKLRQIASQPQALGTFTAFLPGDVAARDELASRLDLRALMGTGKLKRGPIGRREREQARAAFVTCAPLEPDRAELIQERPDSPEVKRAFEPLKECYDRHMPKSPFEYVAYDEHGDVLDRIREPLVSAMVRPPGTIEAEGHEEPGEKRAPRPTQGEGTRTTVLMSGRSPDGALFEFYVERTKYGTCMSVWWPYVGSGASGACGPGLPPSTAFGRRDPEHVFAKPYGFLNEDAEATTYRYVNGFARTNVARVKVVYRDRRGDRHDAPVQMVQVTAPMLEKIESSKPFGYWIAFVPRSAGHRPIEVTAYAEDGGRLGEPFTLERP